MVNKIVTPKDCRSCRRYDDCAGKDWYSYAEIRWCPYQVMWILEHAEELGSGEWPCQDIDTGYIDGVAKRKVGKTYAYFTKPIEVLAEVEYCRERTGVSGKLLKAQVEAGYNLESLEQEAWEALMYIKGWVRKSEPFYVWKKKMNYRQRYQKVH